MAFYNSVSLLEKKIKTTFYKQLGQVTGSLFAPFVMNESSNTNKENYAFSDALPYFQEWQGDVGLNDVKDYTYEIENKHWAIGVNIDRDTLEDTKGNVGGMLEQNIKQVAQQWAS